VAVVVEIGCVVLIYVMMRYSVCSALGVLAIVCCREGI